MRREWVWSPLGQAPLANALTWLVALANESERPLGGARVSEIASDYAEWGWRVDNAALRAPATAERAEDNAAVAAAAGALYRPWLEGAANAFQEAYRLHPNDWSRAKPIDADADTCLLFSDALRYDVGERLREELDRRGLIPSISWRFTALPGVTPTAKPAISPVAHRLVASTGFDTAPANGGAKLTAEKLRDLLLADGYQVLRGSETGTPSETGARGWTELGSIDRHGHERGRELARHLDHEVRMLADRVAALLAAGWREVTVITDHGWLLLPGGLPKADLPKHFTEPRKGRAARIRAKESVDQQTVLWHWDDSVRIAVPPDIRCYEANTEYEHDGLSPQECVIPVLSVRAPASPARPVTISEIAWVRMRCRVTLEGVTPGTRVDIRTRPGDASSSIVNGGAAVEDGRASLVVEDDDHEGLTVTIVVLGPNGTLLMQEHTTVGGNP